MVLKASCVSMQKVEMETRMKNRERNATYCRDKHRKREKHIYYFNIHYFKLFIRKMEIVSMYPIFVYLFNGASSTFSQCQYGGTLTFTLTFMHV